jgi:N-acetylglucosamine-6-phosphate deacetylase
VETTIPGFIDLQVNGYLGTDFGNLSLTSESFVAACSAMLASGSAGILATLGTAPQAVYERNLPIISAALERPELRGRVLGIHLEGPFLCRQPGARGAHNPTLMRDGDVGLLKQLLDLSGGHVRLLTVAAEAKSAEAVARYAADQGITVSVGHTLAGPDDLRRMVDAGATAFTHLGNGLPNLIHRHRNTIFSVLANDDLTAMIITDGHHLPAEAIKTMVRAKGVEQIVVVSDAAHLAGMPPGRYDTEDNEIVLEPSGLLHNPTKQCLVGSSATMLQCMNYLASLDILGLEDMLAVGFANPLRLIRATPADLRAAGAVTYDPTARKFTFAAQG